MDKIRALYKAFGSNLEMPKPQGSAKAKIYSSFGMIAFWGIMIPISVLIGYITYILTDLYIVIGRISDPILVEFHVISAFAMIFGIQLIFSVLFFSSDTAFLTALPIKHTELFTARFWHTFKAENVMTSNVLFAILIGWFVSMIRHFGISAVTPVNIIASLVCLIGALLVPLLYCSVIAMLLMTILSRARSVKTFYTASLIVFLFFTGLFLYPLGQTGGNTEELFYMLPTSSNPFTRLCNIIFPTNYLCSRSVNEKCFLYLIFAVLIIAALYAVTVLIVALTYRNGLFTAAKLGTGAKKKSISSSERAQGTFRSLVSKEFKVLMRTMTYRSNCIYVNLIWPGLAIIGAVALYRNPEFKTVLDQHRWYFPVAAIFISFVASGLNSIASTSFTREGAHFDIIKYLPVRPELTVASKALTAFIISYVPVFISFMIIIPFVAGPVEMVFCILISLICTVASIMTGMTMDSASPYIVWADELSALRGNLNCFFNLAAQLLISGIFGLISFGIFYLTGDLVITLLVLFLILLAVTALFTRSSIRRILKNLEEHT